MLRRQIRFPSTTFLLLLSSCSLLSQQQRCIHSVSLKGGWRSRTLLDDAYDAKEHGLDIRSRERGRVYNRTQNLWPSLVALEIDMTKASFAPAERLPPELLPRDVAALQLEGRIPEDVTNIHDEEKVNFAKSKPQLQEQKLEERKSSTTRTTTFSNEEPPSSQQQQHEDDFMDMDSLAAMAFAQVCSSSTTTSVAAKQQQSSQTELPRNKTILADLHSNDTSNPVATFAACGIDPVLEQRAAEVFDSKGVSRAQARLLPALLNPDHNDVIFGSITGSGKTVALLLAMLQGIRNETSGLNIFVCADSLNCHRVVSLVKKLDEDGIVDIADIKPEKNFKTNEELIEYDLKRTDKFGNINILKDWLMIADRRDDFELSFKELTRSLLIGNQPKRMLICTADTLAEILFEKKLEFAPFGHLRRLYFDDISKDIRFASKTATVEQKQKEFSEPSASQLVLATVHQLMHPQNRSLLQVAAVAADMESDLSKHLLALCVKPNHTVIATPSRLPSTLHCVFSFYAQHTNDKLEYLTTLLRNAAPAIPGRVLLFFPSNVDLLQMKATLMREAGLDAKLLFEVKPDILENAEKKEEQQTENSSSSSWNQGWRYLLLHEHEGFGLDIPLVSHVVLTFVPSNRFSLLHIAGRCARAGNPGWVFSILPRERGQEMAQLCKELDIEVEKTTIDVNLQNVPPEVVKRWIRPPSKWALDPQYIVERRYEGTEDAIRDPTRETMFAQSGDRKERDFKREDYTPISVLDRRFTQIEKLKRDLSKMPEMVVEMAKEGMLNRNTLSPTKKLYDLLDRNESVPIAPGRPYTRTDGLREKKRQKGTALSRNYFN